MADTAADVIADALLHHRPVTNRNGYRCPCGATVPGYGDMWESHLADVAVAALTQAGILITQPTTTIRTDYIREARWRVAALDVVVTWAHQPIPGTDVAAVQQEDLERRWPSLAAAIRRLVHAKAELLENK